MGNEMGNNNNSGFREEERSREAQGNSMQDTVSDDNLGTENRVDPSLEDDDDHDGSKKQIANDDPGGAEDTRVINLISGGGAEKEDVEVDHPGASSESEKKLDTVYSENMIEEDDSSIRLPDAEQDTITCKAQESHAQGSALFHAGEVNPENHLELDARITEKQLDTANPEDSRTSLPGNITSLDIREKEISELDSATESLNPGLESKESDIKNRYILPPSLSEESKGQETTMNSINEEILLEGNEILNANATHTILSKSPDPEPRTSEEQGSDQHGIIEIPPDQSARIDTDTSKTNFEVEKFLVEETVNEEDQIRSEKDFKVGIGNEVIGKHLRGKTESLSDFVGDICSETEEKISSVTNIIVNELLESHLEDNVTALSSTTVATPPEEKYAVVDQETAVTREVSGSEEKYPDHDPKQFYEDGAAASKIDDSKLHHQENIRGSENPVTTMELNPDNQGELFLTTASTFHSRILTLESFVTAVDFASENPLGIFGEKVTLAPVTMTGTISSASEYPSTNQYDKVESPFFVKGNYEPLVLPGRFSIESYPDNMNIHARREKSPSFDIDLRIDVSRDESDQIPLLYQDKSTIDNLSSQADSILEMPLLYTPNNQEYETVPVEEKVINLERNESKKSRTPFVDFSEDDQEQPVIHANATKLAKNKCNVPAKDVTIPTSRKDKDKHKRRTSLFGSCMCCAIVIN